MMALFISNEFCIADFVIAAYINIKVFTLHIVSWLYFYFVGV